MNKILRLIVTLTLLLLITPCMAGNLAPDPAPIQWSHISAQGEQRLDLYFFWSHRCPHCQEARPVVEQIAKERSWLQLHSHEVLTGRKNLELYSRMASSMGKEARSVPAFFFCGQMEVGYDGSGEGLAGKLDECYQRLLKGEDITRPVLGSIEIPLLGKVERNSDSLLLVTVVIAALDAFNPCAFFVLLFLLSLLVNTRSRSRMLFIGGVFVFFSGAIYFLFMAAWLNLFLLTGMQKVFTIAAGLVAVAMALINIKDFFRPGKGPSLSIPEEKKPGLFQRMRGLLQAENMTALTIGTITLAIAANSYELLCTSGLPMVYTRILTLEGLSSADYYLYLLLYNLIYVIPLLIIVLLFVVSLGRHKLQPEEGRLLKLLSGTMMLELGIGLLLAPEMLTSVGTVATAIAGAIVLTLLGGIWLRRRRLK